MANFVRDGIAMEIPEAQLSLIKTCFDKADEKIASLNDKLESLGKVKLKRRKYLADSKVIELLDKLSRDLRNLAKKGNTEDSMVEEEYDIAINEEEFNGDDLYAQLEEIQSQMAELAAREEALLKELEVAKDEEENEDELEKIIEDRVRDRRELERKVFKLLDAPEDELVTKSDRQLKEQLITQRYNFDANYLSNKTNEEVNAMFEIAAMQSTNADKTVKQAFNAPVQIDSRNALSAAYSEHIASVKDAWKTLIK